MTTDLSRLTGFEILEKSFAGHLPAVPIAELLNFRGGQLEKGRVSFVGTPLATMTNPMGTVHGGWYGALLDSAMATAVLSLLPAGASYTTLEYKVNIIRPIPLGMEVEAIGEAQHAGRSTGIARGEIRGVEDGKLYATGSTTCIVMSPGT